MVRAVEAVNFIRWEPAQRHSGADASGPGACATRFNMARACHPLHARAESVGEAPICSLTWSHIGAHDLPISWWRHVEHWLDMPKPPPAVRRARALELLWLRHAHFSTLGPAWNESVQPQFSLYISAPVVARALTMPLVTCHPWVDRP